MVTATRIIWHNYTNSIFNSSTIDIKGLIAKWLAALKYKVKSRIWKCNSTEEKNTDGWDMNGQWAQMNKEHWTTIDDSFATSN